MEMLPLVSCVMSHLEIESFSEYLNNRRMLVHLHVIDILRLLHCIGTKIDRYGVDTPRTPKNVRCSIFNDISQHISHTGLVCFEQWPWGHLDSGLGRQCEGIKCGRLSMECRMICLRKDRQNVGQMQGFSPLSKGIV